MADVKFPEEERSCAEKRKLEVPNPACKTSDEKIEGEDNADSNKKQKLEISDVENGKSENIRVSSVEEEDEDDDEEEEEDYEEEEDEDEEAASPVDRKGKGIMIDDKGKGKVAVYEDSDDEDEDDEDDDDSTDDSDSHCSDRLDGSDVEDNPLAALDLDNILPSRTRQRRAQPGLRISNDRDNNDA